MKNINYTLDFLIDLYKIVSVNEMVLYKDSKVSNDKYYKNKLGSIVTYYLNLPDDYITVSREGVVVEKSSLLLHKEFIKIFGKLQKKHYGDEDKFGINKKSNTITSFYEDTDYICDIYTSSNSFSSKFKEWIKNYSESAVYLETENFKLYGRRDENDEITAKFIMMPHRK